MSLASVSAPKCGTPRNHIGFVCIKWKRDVYDIWNSRKESVGLSNKTHSDFARYLYFSIFVRMRLNLHVFHEQIWNPLTMVNTKLLLVILRIIYSIKICIY